MSRGGTATMVRGGDQIVVPCRPADGALLTYAVNRLPAFLAAVEALQRVVVSCDMGFYGAAQNDVAIEAARAALAPFTEEPK